ncbi:MAG: hypothetical protein LLG04_03355 [Parachlamydia sp.]|nr:hypothetical protein [Parachlamydia sp.]
MRWILWKGRALASKPPAANLCLKRPKQMKDDPKATLQDAIAKLVEFNQENASPSLNKTIGLMRSYFKAKFSEKSTGKNWREVRRAIDILKSHYRLIEKFQGGTPQEQKLAASAVSAIEQYNVIIDTARQKPKSINARIHNFLREQSGSVLPIELSKIQFPKSASVQISYLNKEKSCSLANPLSAASRKIAHLSSTLVPVTPLPHTALPHLSRQAIELFHMKAISLIEQHGLLSNSDARNAMRKAHLQSQFDSDLDPSQCIVFCTLTPFPGHMITVSGTFERDASKENPFALPKNNSFYLTLTCTHSGFPYPSQYTGWALPDLVPVFPHCLEDLPLFKTFYQRKQDLAHHLQPNQEKVDFAKARYALKKETAENNKDEYLPLQRELCLAMAQAASPESISDHVKSVILHFFDKLKQVHHFFDYYAETLQLINDSFIVRPYAQLEATWLEKKSAPLVILGQEAEKARQEFLNQKNQAHSELETSTLDFILAMGSLLATPCHRILLQHFSETRFPPPMLDDFEQKLQTALYRQLSAFLSEMDGADHNLLDQIRTDIALFKAPSFESVDENDPAAQIVVELEAYFNTRHYTTLN